MKKKHLKDVMLALLDGVYMCSTRSYLEVFHIVPFYAYPPMIFCLFANPVYMQHTEIWVCYDIVLFTRDLTT